MPAIDFATAKIFNAGKSAPSLGQFIFLTGGAYNAAVARMLLAVSLWLSLHSVGTPLAWDSYIASNSAGWVPKGLVKLLNLVSPGAPPSQSFVVGLFYLAKISTALMFIGLLSRASTIVAALSVTLFASLMCSFGPYWSHGFNVQLLAALAFMFGRSGDVLSVDSVVRYLIGRPVDRSRYAGRYWWPVLFAELATHMFMFAAFFQKVTNGDGIWWALSDNLRNSVAVSWGLYRGAEIPEIAAWFISSPWIYKTAGVLQLIAQASTIFCLFLVRWPIPRMIIGGLFFFLEILGLTHLFHFWHPFWVPLCLLSIDWEWLVKRATTTSPNVATFFRSDIAAVQMPSAYSSAVYGFGLLFFGYYAASFLFSLGEKHLNYPFSSMAFYSENRHIRPFNKPNYYPIYRGAIEIIAEGEHAPIAITNLPSDVGEALKYYTTAPTEEVATKLRASIRARMSTHPWRENKEWTPPRPIASLKAYRQIAAVPPSPRDAVPLVVLTNGLLFVDDHRGIRGVASELSFDQASSRRSIKVSPWGFPNPKIRILARIDVREAPTEGDPHPIDGGWSGNTFFISRTKGGKAETYYTVIEVTDPELGVREVFAGPENFEVH